MSFSDYFNGKHILVTGAGRGIGRAAAVRLYGYGATVYALSQNPENLSTLKSQCPNIKIICVDLSDWSATRNEVSKLGPLDGLINNAAFLQVETFMTICPRNFDKQFNVNVKAVVNVSQIVAKKMIEGGKCGSIANISSVAGKRAITSFPVYSATKAAMDMMTKAMAVELGPNKIRVNSLNLGCVDTDMLRNALGGIQKLNPPDDPLMMDKLQERIPLKQNFINMDEVVNTISFVLSDMTTMMTGETIVLDGGFLAT